MIMDYRDEVLKHLNAHLDNARSNLESCKADRHDYYVGMIGGLRQAVDAVTSVFRAWESEGAA